jgi:hypothetical protein
LKTLFLSFLNIGLLLLFIRLFWQKNLLSFNQGGRVWLTFLAVGVITLMDELPSVFYAPAEAFRFIGLSAIFFIAVTSLLIRFLSNRLVEIAEILAHPSLIGGGVYSFSYLVLGPSISFVAVASIMVDYILTACISSVSEGDLITHYATMINGVPLGVAVASLASFTLIIAVNTAFAASSELIERIAHRYGFLWLIKTNRRNSLYRIHLINAALFSTIIFLTSGSQMILADMYAIGLVASFCINMGALIIYRYLRGTKEVISYNTSRLGTLIIWVIMVSCFIFLAIDQPHGTTLWASVTGGVLLAGFLVARRRAPELKEIAKADDEMAMVLSQEDDPEIHLFFRRSEKEGGPARKNAAYLTFYSPRAGAPPKEAENHFLFPRLFPQFAFDISYSRKSVAATRREPDAVRK